MKLRLAALAWTLLFCQVAHAAGFSLDVQSARAVGMGIAMTAHVDDPSALFYNPAGMVQTDELTVMAGAALISPLLQFTSGPQTSQALLAPGVTTHNVFGVVPPPHLFVTAKLGDNLAVGLGEFTNFGNELHWPTTWQGRFEAVTTSLATFDLNPSVAYRVHPQVRLGAGVQLVRGSVEVVRKLSFVDSEGTADITGSAFGVGFNAGLQADVIKDVLSVGLAYRSGVSLPFAGTAHFTDVPIEFASIVHDQRIRTTFRTPNTVFGGLALRLGSLLLASDFQYYRWRSFREISVAFDDPSLNTVIPKHWHDTYNFHLGAEYHVSPAIALRAGAVYDPAPGTGTSAVPGAPGAGQPAATLTPDLPDSNRLVASVGAGFTRERLQFDAAYLFVYLVPVRSSAPGYPGQYSGAAHVLSFTVTYRP